MILFRILEEYFRTSKKYLYSINCTVPEAVDGKRIIRGCGKSCKKILATMHNFNCCINPTYLNGSEFTSKVDNRIKVFLYEFLLLQFKRLYFFCHSVVDALNVKLVRNSYHGLSSLLTFILCSRNS